MAAQNLLSVTNTPQKVQLARIAHVIQKHPDLRRWEEFAKDFGSVEAGRQGGTAYYRGFRKDPYCVVACASESGKMEFGDISSAPGGGQMVSIPTPTNNFIHVIWGQTERENAQPTNTIKIRHEEFNTSLEKARKGEFQRFKHAPAPAPIHKLGHYGYITKKFEEDVEFYTSNFNFVVSDILTNSKGQDNDCFFHLDLGEEYSDHHTLFLIRAPSVFPETRMHHTSFEVDDFDTQLIGHEWLLKKKYKLVWGVGRRVLGSQIFDYWRDPSGFTIEHYADGDLLNQDHKISREPQNGALSLAVWGPEFHQVDFAGLTSADLVKIVLKLLVTPFTWPLISVWRLISK